MKGWIENNQLNEKVYDVVCSDGLKVEPLTNRCPDNGAKVDIETCSISNNGANELSSFWSDPDFDKDMRAFYYVRVLENPTCRWSTWDAIREGVSPRPDMQKTIQDLISHRNMIFESGLKVFLDYLVEKYGKSF